MKEYIRWIDDTVMLVLEMKNNRPIDPESEVAPVVDGIIMKCIGNREEIDESVVKQMCESTIAWAYLQLREILPVPDTSEFKTPSDDGNAKKCILEMLIGCDRDPSAISIKTDKSNKKWPLDESGTPVQPDARSVVVDGGKVDRIIVVV